MGWSVADVKRLLAHDPIRLQKALPPQEIEAIAQRVYRQIRQEVTGPIDQVQTWSDTCPALFTRIVPADDCPGPAFYDVEEGIIYVRLDSDEETICRRIVHELAHHVLVHFRIRPRRRPFERYDDNRASVEHRIAQAVEALFFERKI